MFFVNGQLNRDVRKDDTYVVLETAGTPGARGGSGGAFLESGARISIPAPILGATADGTWQAVADVSGVEENTGGVTVGVASLTLDTAGYFIIGADIDVTQSVLHDPELEYRVSINGGAKTLDEGIRIYEADVLQNETSKCLCYLEAGDVLTLEYKASLDDLDINYFGLYVFSLTVSGAIGGSPDITALQQRWQVNTETIAADKTLMITSEGIQNLENLDVGTVHDVILPGTPNPSQFFAVLNQSTSTEDITVDSAGLNITLVPGDTAEIIYDDTAAIWIVL